MRKLLFLLLGAMALSAFAAPNTCNVQWVFTDFNLNPQSVMRATQTPLVRFADNGTILTPSPIAQVTSGAGSATFSNTLSGYTYRIQIDTPFGSTVRTCGIPASVTGNINGSTYVGNIGGLANGAVTTFYYLYSINAAGIATNLWYAVQGSNAVVVTNFLGTLITFNAQTDTNVVSSLSTNIAAYQARLATNDLQNPARMGTNVLLSAGANVTIGDSYSSGVHTYTIASTGGGAGGSATNAVSAISDNGTPIGTGVTNLSFWPGTNTTVNLTNRNGLVDVSINSTSSGVTNNQVLPGLSSATNFTGTGVFSGVLRTTSAGGSNAIYLNSSGVAEIGFADNLEQVWFKQPPIFDASTVSNLQVSSIVAGGISNSNLWNGKFVGTHGGNGAAISNAVGVPLGDYGMNNVQALWAKLIRNGSLRILSLGDSTGGDVQDGMIEHLHNLIGINGTGISAQSPIGPYLDFKQSGGVASLNSSGFFFTNWIGLHYGLSNNGALYMNRYATYSVGSAWPMNTNVWANTCFFAWVNRPGGGSFTLQVSTNGLPFFTFLTVDTAQVGTPSLGYTNYYVGTTTNITFRAVGTGGGDNYAEVLGGGTYVTNGAGALVWNAIASGGTWEDFLGANTNVLIPYLGLINPDIVVIESVHGPVPQAAINLLTNLTPAQIVLMGCPPSVGNANDYTYKLSYTNRQTAIYGQTNAFNHLAFCDTYSHMTDTNANALYGFYVGGADIVHFSGYGQTYEANTFLRSIGMNDAFANVSPLGQGKGANLFNVDLPGSTAEPVGVGFYNGDSRLGKFAVQLTSANYLGLGTPIDQAGYMGLFGYDSSRQLPLYPYNGPFTSQTNFALFWQNNSILSLQVPGGGGELCFGGGNSYSGGSPEVARFWRSGMLDVGDFLWKLGITDFGAGVVSIKNALYIDQGTARQILATNGMVTAINGFSSRSNVFTLMPTNAPAVGQVIKATATTGHTQWADEAGTGSSNITDSAYTAVVRNLSVQTNAFLNNLTVTNQANFGGGINVTSGTPGISISNGLGANADYWNIYTNAASYWSNAESRVSGFTTNGYGGVTNNAAASSGSTWGTTGFTNIGGVSQFTNASAANQGITLDPTASGSIFFTMLTETNTPGKVELRGDSIISTNLTGSYSSFTNGVGTNTGKFQTGGLLTAGALAVGMGTGGITNTPAAQFTYMNLQFSTNCGWGGVQSNGTANTTLTLKGFEEFVVSMGNTIVQLGDATTNLGHHISITCGSTGTNAITTVSSQKIAGQAKWTNTVYSGCTMLISDGANWQICGSRGN